MNWFSFGAKSRKRQPTSDTELVTHRWYGSAIVVGKEKNNVFVSSRGRVTKVTPECLRKASVAEQMSWDITTKEKALFEMTLDEENTRGEEPLLDESGEFHESETPDTMARPMNLNELVNSPMNDDGELPLSLNQQLRRKTITVKTRHMWKNRIQSPRSLEMLSVSRCGFLNVV